MAINMFLLLMMILVNEGIAQEINQKERSWSAKGYIKSLQSIIPIGGADHIIVDNLFHNRINLRWFPSDAISGRFELRSRIFYGELVKSIPGFGDELQKEKGLVDLSWSWINEPAVVAHTTIDRAYLQWTKRKFEFKVGRQRINWGINAVWNPNDIFNTFSFFDFDYTERPGTDAVHLQYYTGSASSVELAVKPAKTLREFVAGGLWKFNKKGYDIQLLAGKTEDHIALGGGWAGNIKNSGFKGEFTYFLSSSALSIAPRDIFAIALSLDHSFKNQVYVLGSFLYNKKRNSPTSLASLQNFEISAMNLSPFEITWFIQVMKPISPLVNGGIALMYSPTFTTLFFNPLIGFSLADNFDVSVLTQVFISEGSLPGQLYYIQMKYSF